MERDSWYDGLQDACVASRFLNGWHVHYRQKGPGKIIGGIRPFNLPSFSDQRVENPEPDYYRAAPATVMVAENLPDGCYVIDGSDNPEACYRFCIAGPMLDCDRDNPKPDSVTVPDYMLGPGGLSGEFAVLAVAHNAQKASGRKYGSLDYVDPGTYARLAHEAGIKVWRVKDGKLREFSSLQPQHRTDSDCTIDPNTDCCADCGVYHGDPCPDCGERGYHGADCPQRDAS